MYAIRSYYGRLTLSLIAQIGENSAFYAVDRIKPRFPQGLLMSNADNAAQPVPQDENHIIAERRAKLAEWRKTGQAFRNNFV